MSRHDWRLNGDRFIQMFNILPQPLHETCSFSNVTVVYPFLFNLFYKMYFLQPPTVEPSCTDLNMEVSNHSNSTPSRSNSRTSSASELEKEIGLIDITGLNSKSGGVNTKKRMSSSRTSTSRARRIRFYRNGDKFYGGIVIAVSNERYR